jgi:spore cortex biosynthesis protein YabQ
MAAALVVGMALGLWLELYRGHLRAARPRRAALVVRDLLFWTGATLMAAFGLYFANWLALRLYALCAMVLGSLLASALAGPVVRPAAGGATRAGQALIAATLWPLRALSRAIGRPRPPAPAPPAPPVARREPWWRSRR